jgi:hypothetical protein
LRRFVLLALATLLAIAGAITVGAVRYGSVDGVYRKIHAEVVARQPHPLLVPTPLPISGLAVASADSGPTAIPTATGCVGTPASQPQPAPTRQSRPSAPSPLQPMGQPIRTATPTVPASPRPTQAPTETPTSTPAAQPAPASVQLTGLSHWWQTWNNCGPATLAMDLSYYGINSTQESVAAALRPNREDKNVSPEEMAAFARSQGLRALARVDGDAHRLRQLLAYGVPVLVETWHEPKPNDGMGHYRLLTGYDDAAQAWTAYDSYDATGIDPKQPYAGIHIPYAGYDPLWKVFNRQYVVVYTDAQAAVIDEILGDDAVDQAMWERALGDAEAAVEREPEDPFAWFNLGSDLAALGRYEEAAQAYDRARQIGLPWRMLWYQFGPFQAYYHTGRHEEVIALANATIRMAKYIEELYYWRGLSELALGKPGEARASFLTALEMNRNFAPATEALAALPAP